MAWWVFSCKLRGLVAVSAVVSVRLRTRAFSSGSLVLPVPGRRVLTAATLSAHVSIWLLISPHQTRRPPRRAAEIGIGCVLCVVAGVELVAELIEH